MKYRLTRGDLARRGGVLVAVALAHVVIVLGLMTWIFGGPKLPPMMVTSVTEEAAPPPAAAGHSGSKASPTGSPEANTAH